jgi:hypothetical protein
MKTTDLIANILFIAAAILAILAFVFGVTAIWVVDSDLVSKFGNTAASCGLAAFATLMGGIVTKVGGM